MDQTPLDSFLGREPSGEPPRLRWAERPSRIGSLAVRHRQRLGGRLRIFLGVYALVSLVAGGLALNESSQDWQVQSYYWQGSEVGWTVVFGLLVLVLVLGGYAGLAALMLWTYGTVSVVRNWTSSGLSPRLAGWGWLIPFVNLVVPVWAVRLIARGSSDGRSGSRLAWLGLLWWSSWVALLTTSVLGGILSLWRSSAQGQHEVFMRSMVGVAGLAALWGAIGVFFVGSVDRSLADTKRA